MIIIDSDNYAEHGIETMFFPGGEPHVKIPRFKEMPVLFLKLRTWNDTGFAALLIDALHQQFTTIPRIFIPYFPGARQDKTDGMAPLTVHVMNMLLSEELAITVFDRHSGHTPGINMMPADLLDVPIKDDVVGIIAPDAGAIKRAISFRDNFYPNAQIVQCNKERNPATGKLSRHQMEPLPFYGRYIIVDDICDGGGTFNLLAEAWKKDRLSKDCNLELFVSHGIFSKGLNAIDPVIEHIATTDSWFSYDESPYVSLPSSRVTVLPLLSSYLKFIGATA